MAGIYDGIMPYWAAACCVLAVFLGWCAGSWFYVPLSTPSWVFYSVVILLYSKWYFWSDQLQPYLSLWPWLLVCVLYPFLSMAFRVGHSFALRRALKRLLREEAKKESRE